MNDRFLRALGVIVVNINYVQSQWQLVYFNKIVDKYDENITNLMLSNLLDKIEKEIKVKYSNEQDYFSRLYDLIEQTRAINKKRNSKVHAVVHSFREDFYISERSGAGRSMDDLNDKKIDEIEIIGDEIAEVGHRVKQLIDEMILENINKHSK